MSRLGGGDDPLSLREQHRRLEDRVLCVRLRLHVSLAHEEGDGRRVAVVPQPSGVHRRRYEVVAERVHRHDRRHLRGIAVVVGEHAFRERRTRCRLGREEPGVRISPELVRHERVRDAGEVRAPADAPDDHVGLLTGELHLLLRLETDHALMQQHVPEHAAERVVRVLVGRSVLHRFADRDPERARRVRMGIQDPAPGVRRRGRRGQHVCPERLHEHPAVRLLVVGSPHHVHGALEPEEAAGHRHRRAPLAGPRLGRDPPDTGFLVVVRLGHGGVRLV